MAIYIYYLSTPTKIDSVNDIPSFDEDVKSTTTIEDKNIKETNTSNIPKELDKMNEDLQDMQKEIQSKLQEESVNELSKAPEDEQIEQEIAEADGLINKVNEEADINASEVEQKIEEESNMPLATPEAIEIKEDLKKTNKIIDHPKSLT